MKLPIIRSLTEYSEEKGPENIQATIDTLEHLSQARGIKDEELDVIGEILSNLYGSLEVRQMIESGQEKRQAMNDFMKRVVGSIDN
jgi:hypothetical protein